MAKEILMTKSKVLVFSMALALGAGLGVGARAAEVDAQASGVGMSVGQTASMPADEQSVEAALAQDAQQSYRSNTNPLASARLSGPYDGEDAFKGKDGYPLPGWDVFTVDGQAAGD
jgi:hypothetical protein